MKEKFLQQFHFLGWHCEAIAAPVILSHSCLLVHLIVLFFIRILSYFFTSPFWPSCWSDLRSDWIHCCCSDYKPVPVISRQRLWAMSLFNNMFMFDSVYLEDNHTYSAALMLHWERKEIDANGIKTDLLTMLWGRGNTSKGDHVKMLWDFQTVKVMVNQSDIVMMDKEENGRTVE